MKPNPHFLAHLVFLPETKGKSSTPVSSGYRYGIKFSSELEQFIGIQDYLDIELVFPGDSVTAEITMLSDFTAIEKLYAGLDFDFFEGENRIGHGVIAKMI